jgi:hypothetical protein
MSYIRCIFINNWNGAGNFEPRCFVKDTRTILNYCDVRRAAMALVLVAAAAPAFAQADMRGHWSGSIVLPAGDTPAGPMVLEVDLDKAGSGWIGSVSIPAQGASGFPLDAITFSDGKGAFRLKGAPGDAGFAGTLSADGKKLEGKFNQGTASLPLTLTKTGEAKVAVAKPSPAVTAEFVGTWEGSIQLGPGLRIALTISNGKAGAEATMVSLDQGNAQIPVSAITQKGSSLTLVVNAVGGGYVGEINKEGTELNGTWTQLGNSAELKFKKAAKP